MQHALLGLAIAFIVAVAAALAAPAYVNWDDWRSSFESHATALAGAPVRIRGRIEAKILPTPAFVFRDVEIGNPENGSGARVGEVRGVLSLGALLRGSFEAEEFALVRPAMRVQADGKAGVMPAIRGALAPGGLVALARLTVERGSLTVDRGGTAAMFDDIYAQGEMHAPHGPLRVDGVFRLDGRRWGLRLNTGQFSGDGSARARLTLEQAAAGRSYDADGNLSLGGAAPRFEGKVVAAYRPVAGMPAGMPWQASANLKADENAASLEGLQLTLGKYAAPTDLEGKLVFEPRDGGSIGGKLSARRVDLDMAAGGDRGAGLPAAMGPLHALLAFADGLPLQGSVGFDADALVAAGGTLRDVRASLALRDGVASLDRFSAQLPGRGSIEATGAAKPGARFSGKVSLHAEDAAAFVRWAFGGKAAPLRDAGTVRIAGDADWREGGVRLTGFEFSLGAAKLGGNLSVEPGGGPSRPRLAAELTADGADLDLLRPVAEWLHGVQGNADVSLALRGADLRLLGRPLQSVDVSISRTGEGLAIERLALERFDGLSMRASGRIAAPVERPSGKIDFELSTTRPDGLAALAGERYGEETARLIRHLAGSGSPLTLSGTATGAGSAAGVEVNGSGTLGDFDLALAANFDLLTETLAEAHVTLDARDPRAFPVLFGLSPGLPAAGSGHLEIDVSRPNDGALPIEARLSLPGAELSAQGDIRKSKEGRIEPRLEVKVKASDLRTALYSVAQLGRRAVPAEGGWRVARNEREFRFEEIALSIDGSEVKGALALSDLSAPLLNGRLSVERLAAVDLLSVAVGRASDNKSFWPAARFGAAPLADATGAIEFEVDTLDLPASLAASNAKFRLRLGAGSVALEELTGDLAGGKVSASANFVRGQTLAFDGRAAAENFDLAQMLAAGEQRSEMRGRGSLTLSLAGTGATPQALASSLAGQGTIALENLEIDRADPSAVGQVFAAGESSEPRDEISVISMLSPALARAPLKIAKLEAPLIVAGGSVRAVQARASAGQAQITAEASLDIARLAFEAAIEMEIEAAKGAAVQPGATVRWRGPLAAPERGIEAAALANAINLRAMERETKRIEERDRALPPRTNAAPPPENNPIAAIPPITRDPAAAAPAGNAAESPSAAVPLPQSRPRAADRPRTALPPLPPPTEIRPLPPVYRPEN